MEIPCRNAIVIQRFRTISGPHLKHKPILENLNFTTCDITNVIPSVA